MPLVHHNPASSTSMRFPGSSNDCLMKAHVRHGKARFLRRKRLLHDHIFCSIENINLSANDYTMFAKQNQEKVLLFHLLRFLNYFMERSKFPWISLDVCCIGIIFLNSIRTNFFYIHSCNFFYICFPRLKIIYWQLLFCKKFLWDLLGQSGKVFYALNQNIII